MSTANGDKVILYIKTPLTGWSPRVRTITGTQQQSVYTPNTVGATAAQARCLVYPHIKSVPPL